MSDTQNLSDLRAALAAYKALMLGNGSENAKATARATCRKTASKYWTERMATGGEGESPR